MLDVSQSETFQFTWKVEKFHLTMPTRGKYSCISTPIFQVGVLHKTKWIMQLELRRIGDPLFWGCRLIRISSPQEPEVVKFNWTICIISEGGAVRFQKECTTTLKKKESVTLARFIRESDILPTDTPQNNLTIQCQIANDSIFSTEFESRYDLESLSSDLAWLLESRFRSDFKIYCRGEIFNVHKFILMARWPNFCGNFNIEDISTKEDMIMTCVESSTLSAFLSFLYTGKLPSRDLSMDLCSYMHEHYCSELLNNFETPASNLEFVTHMHYEYKNLIWEVGDDEILKAERQDLYRMIPLEAVYPSEMVMKFSFEERNRENWLKLTLIFTGFSAMSPLFLSGEISFKNKEIVIYSSKLHHYLASNEEWVLPRLVRKRELIPNKSNSKQLIIQLYICDGVLKNKLVSSNIHKASRFQEVKDLRKLHVDIHNSKYPTDMTLKISGHVYPAHSIVLAARSTKFRELIQQNCVTIEMDDFRNDSAVVLFIIYLYGGCLPYLSHECIIELNRMARRYLLTGLEEKTRKLLTQRQ